MKEFSGRVTLVTGTTGIGRAIALRFAAGGAQVVACGIEAVANEELARDAAKVYAGARDPASLADAQRRHGERIVPVRLDVTSDDERLPRVQVLAHSQTVRRGRARASREKGALAPGPHLGCAALIPRRRVALDEIRARPREVAEVVADLDA